MSSLRRVRLEEVAVVGVLAFYGIAGSIPGIAPNQANEMTGAAASRMQTVVGVGSQLLVNGLIGMLLISWRGLLSQHRAALRWAAALAVWAVFSIGWSQEPWLTGRRALPFLLATAFGMLLALRYRQEQLLGLLRGTFGVLACWSAVLALGFPGIGLDASTGHGGDWQGVFTQKNACGRAMVFAIAAMLAQGRWTLGRGALLLLFAAELALSGSRGAWLLAAVTVAALLMFRGSCRFDRGTRVAIFALLGCAALAATATVLLQFGELAPWLGRDATLTGRTAIWREVWLSIQHRPALGYGFSAFWRGAQGASWSVVLALRFVLFHAHNGFLEIWLELGAVGLLVFAAGFVRAAVLLWPELREGHYRDAAWPAAVLLLVALYDVDENTLLSFNGLFWVLYVAALVRIELLAGERRLIRQGMPRESAGESFSGLSPGARPWLYPVRRAWLEPQAKAFERTGPRVDPRTRAVSPWL